MFHRPTVRGRRGHMGRRSHASARQKSGHRRKLAVEPLEARDLLAVFTVSNLNDAAVAAAGDAPGTLRQAIFDANSAMGPDDIVFDAGVSGTITLTEGELVIDDALTISGPGAQLLTIDASGSDPTPAMNNGDGSRVFHIDDGAAGTDSPVSISGLTITGGDAGDSGGGIRSLESLTLSDSVVTGNATQDDGGGVFASTNAGAIMISRSTISGNSASDLGGGVYSYTDTGTASISDSTIAGNSSDTGGGLFSRAVSGNVAVSRSTFSGNEVGNDGGGIASYTDTGATAIINTTISGNNAETNGGGIFATTATGGTTTVVHSTITLNTANSDLGVTGSGGGVFGSGPGALVIDHTIIAGNFDSTTTAPDLDATSAATPPMLSATFNLIGINSGSGLAAAPVGMPDAMGNLVGEPLSPIDPLLGPLANHGGPTATHRLLAGSPAIDAGDVAIAMPPSSDQRGAPFVRVFDGDAIAGARIDIGSFERQTVAALSLVVDTLIDENDGDYSPGDLSLREAVGLANGSLGADTIAFADALSGGTITLVLGEIEISEEVVVDASSLANGVTVDAAGNDLTPGMADGMGSRIFNINDFDLAASNPVALINVTLINGDVDADGGAIRTSEDLSIIDSVIMGNSAAGASSQGGGIYATTTADEINILRSTISNNTATASGGGLYFDTNTGMLSITESTIDGNSAAGDGGGVYASAGAGTISIADSTFSGNATLSSGGDSDGGGLFAATSTGSTTVINSTFSANMAEDSGGGAFFTSGVVGAATIRHSTFTLNVADSNSLGAGSGGGIHGAGDGTFILEHTIVAENTDNTGTAPDLDLTNNPPGAILVRFNLVGINTGSGLAPAFPDANGNLVGSILFPLDPQLEPLADNGGPTMTHALMATSPAIDRGDPAAIAGVGSVPEFDQRGDPFLRVLDGDGIAGPRIDIGAFEFPEIILPDEFEPNNSIGTATVLGSLPEVTLRDLTIHNAGDQDFFKITANQTGKLIVRTFFTHVAGDLDIEIQDMFGNVIALSDSTDDDEELIIPVVGQEMYFIRVFGFGGAVNVYDLEIENFAAPVPSAIHLDPASDVISPLGDNVISDASPSFFIHVDVLNFVDPNGDGVFDIPVLTAEEAAMGLPGIAVEVRLVNTSDPLQPPIVVFADPVSPLAPTVYRVTVPGPLADGVYFASAATRIFDGQGDDMGAPAPAAGRSELSPPLWFTIETPVDSPELGVWAAGTVLVDTAGAGDLAFHLGFSSDYVFAGNFAPVGGMANGFDKLAVYGRVGNQFRWLIDFTGDGVPDASFNEFAINGIPVAGDFDDNPANGDEVGLFTGNAWHLDTNHDFQIDSMYAVVGNSYSGFPIVGDFDGDGDDDLGTYIASQAGGNLFSIDLNVPAMGGRLHVDGVADRSFRMGLPPLGGPGGFFGFPGVRERPVAADMNADGVDDIGLWVPDGTALVPGDMGEWFFLVSDNDPATMAVENTVLDRIQDGPLNGFVSFSPRPFGNDIYAQFGNSFALPVVGNFVPLPTPADATAPLPEVIAEVIAAPTVAATRSVVGVPVKAPTVSAKKTSLDMAASVKVAVMTATSPQRSTAPVAIEKNEPDKGAAEMAKTAKTPTAPAIAPAQPAAVSKPATAPAIVQAEPKIVPVAPSKVSGAMNVKTIAPIEKQSPPIPSQATSVRGLQAVQTKPSAKQMATTPAAVDAAVAELQLVAKRLSPVDEVVPTSKSKRVTANKSSTPKAAAVAKNSVWDNF